MYIFEFSSSLVLYVITQEHQNSATSLQWKKKKLTEKDREILQERSELCKGDTREGCLYGLLLRPRGAAKCTCTTYNQKLGMVL